jgi:hypothetical protein
VSQNWFYYWNQAVGDTNAMWDDSGHTVFGEVPFMHDWGTYAGPTRRINIAPDLKDGDARDYNNLPAPWYWTSRAVSNSGSIVNAGKISGIDAFFVTIKHEQRHVAQITYSEQMPYWQRNGVARDGVSNSGWSWNVPAVDARYNHLDPGSDGAPGGTGAAADTDLDQTHNHTATNHGATGTHFDLGKDLRTGGLDLTGGFRDTPGDPQNTAVEKQAREVETEKDHGKASFDWGNPGKNHQSINNPND